MREPDNDPLRQMVDQPLDRNERAGMGSTGVMVALAFAIVLGLMFWGLTDGRNRAADNTAPAVTTGSSANTTPSPSNPPAGVKGQGESNSTR